MASSIHFRNDINALRALAVIGVLLFHYKAHPIYGGFAGVDVFFVVSGYLMTAIITSKIESRTFNVLDFYRARAKRIIPPLIGVVLCLTIGGFFFIDPYDYEKLGSTAISALLFFSNFRFWSATSYFDPESEGKWLLHTWSLSVEWPFYLLYPIFLLGLYRFVKIERVRFVVLFLTALASLIACICFSNSNPASTFYLLPFRAWELLAGGIVAIRFDMPPSKRLGVLQSYAGLALIVYAFLAFDDKLAWPYFWAVIPVAGTCLVISARANELKLFTNPATRFIGQWSYSIYLWHWPIAVAAHYIGYTNPLVAKTIGELAVLSLIIGSGALISHLLTHERKQRIMAWVPRLISVPGAVAFLILLSSEIFITASNGLPTRKPDGVELLAKLQDEKADFTFPKACTGPTDQGKLRPCKIGESDAVNTVLIIGDSQVMQIYPRFSEALANKHKASFTFLASPGCPPIPDVNVISYGVRCMDFMRDAFHEAETGRYNRVILASLWREIEDFDGLDPAFAALNIRLSELHKRGIAVVIVSSTPTSHVDVPKALLRSRFFGYPTGNIEFVRRASTEKDLAKLKPRLKSLAEASGAKFMDPLDYLCTADGHCPTTGANGDSLFWDQSHYRAQAVKSPLFRFLDTAAGLTGGDDIDITLSRPAPSKPSLE